MMKQTQKRILKNDVFFWSVCLLAAATAIPLFAIIGTVVWKGWGQINLHFFTQSVPSTYEAMLANSQGRAIPGGIANGIVGTLLMVAMAAAAAIPAGIVCGIFLSEKKDRRMAHATRLLADILQGTPSIVIGIIVYLWIVVPFRSYSAVAGAAALAVMMLPLIIRSTEETLAMLPGSMKEAGLALGCSHSAVVLRVMVPSAFGGIFTGILLSVSRVVGETAPLMLTALGASAVQWNVGRPSSAVSLLIWEFYNDPNLQSMIWSASLFLLLFVLLLNFSAKKISKKWNLQ